MANSGILKEYSMSVNDFNQPAEAKGKKAIGVLLVRLLLMEKGTDPMRPDMGVGIVSRYRYMFPEDCTTLENDIRDQLQRFLTPYANISVIEATVVDKELHLRIVIDDTTYSYKTIHLSDDNNVTLVDLMDDESEDIS